MGGKKKTKTKSKSKNKKQKQHHFSQFFVSRCPAYYYALNFVNKISNVFGKWKLC